MSRAPRTGISGRLLAVLVMAAATAALLASRGHAGLELAPPGQGATLPADVTAVEVAELIDRLAELPTGPIAADRPYAREEFGQRWADVDRTGCDQRNEALAQAMTDVVFRPGTRDCVVEQGTFYDPYTADGPLAFVKSEDGGGLHIDHVVPLAESFRMGAAAWTPAQREEFANTLANLQPTQAWANQDKGDSPPPQWLPPAENYRCTYAWRWTQIKVDWDLAVTAAERNWLTSELRSCAS